MTIRSGTLGYSGQLTEFELELNSFILSCSLKDEGTHGKASGAWSSGSTQDGQMLGLSFPAIIKDQACVTKIIE